jgi:hypothetical protein
MSETYGEVFSGMIDRQARYMDRAEIFRRMDISRAHFYNVINPNKITSGGNPYPFPTEWGVRMTKEFRDYEWIKIVAKDCNCLCITPDELEQLRSGNHEETLTLIQNILGIAKK